MPYLVLSLSPKAAGTILFNTSSFRRNTHYLITLIRRVSSCALTTLLSPSHVGPFAKGSLQISIRSETASASNLLNDYTVYCMEPTLQSNMKWWSNTSRTTFRLTDVFLLAWLSCFSCPHRVKSKMKLCGHQPVSRSFKLIDDNAKRLQKINKKSDRSGCRDIDDKPYDS